jgi:hypothetical protein
MVVVQVADDDVGHLLGVDVDSLEAFGDRLHDDAAAFGGHRGIEPGIEDEGAVRPLDHPHEVSKRFVGVVGIAADVVLVRGPIVMPVAHCVDLMNRARHGRL